MTRSDHPYRHVEPNAFWRRAVAGLPMADVDPVGRFDLLISPESRVATAGSCFAQHIARHLATRGFNYYVAEPGHPIVPEDLRREHNYGVFSARYGNIYTARQLLQLVDRAFGTFQPAEGPWLDADGSVRDPFRPAIQPGNFISIAEMEADRAQHLAAVREIFERLDVFVFTMGLTECWISKDDGAVFPVCPGVEGGEFDPNRYEFYNQSVDEVVHDLNKVFEKLRAINPGAQVVLTVSPVPLAATAVAGAHVLPATTYSKSVLRVAAQMLTDQHDNVHYFPSFEVITGAYNRGAYYADDLRNVVEAGVEHVMRLFLRHATNLEENTPAQPRAVSEEQRASDAFLRRSTEFVAVECEEALLDEFADDAGVAGDELGQDQARESAAAAGVIRNFCFGAPQTAAEFVGARTAFKESRGFGWIDAGVRRDVVRGETADGVQRGFVLGAGPSVLRLKLQPGRYDLQLRFGDAKGVARAVSVTVAGSAVSRSVETRDKIVQSVRLPVETADGVIDICLDEVEGVARGWALIQLEVLAGGLVAPESPEIVEDPNDLWRLPEETSAGPHALLARWRESIDEGMVLKETGIDREGYLGLISGCVDHFRDLQDENGAIIDPYLQVEFQYSTPCYAYASALLAVHGARPDLAPSSLAAFTFAAAALANRTAADGHEDFYPSPLAHAYALLAQCVEPQALERAAAPLRDFKARRTYRKPPGGRKRSGANWNCKALAGQWLLIQQGLQPDDGYVAESLLKQGRWFDNEHGLYAEGPATYDIFPRAWLADMLAHGYEGPKAEVLEDALERGAISSLFMQSPTGELSIGGRSSHHQWSDALQCVVFEWAAARALARGERDLGGVFKRGARRAVQALLPWKRDSGELWIVKNRVDPGNRHGFEPYSSHSQYNLLTATALGFAFELAGPSEDLTEAPTPAESGRFVLETSPGIDRAFACADGTQVEVALAPVPSQTPRGIVRVHMKDLPSQLPMTDGTPCEPMFNLPAPQSEAIALGLGWEPPGERSRAKAEFVSVAALEAQFARSSISRHAETVHGVFLGVRHEILLPDSPRFIDESIEVEDSLVTVTWTWDADWTGAVALRIPIFAGDGRERSKIRSASAGGEIIVDWAGARCRFLAPDGAGRITVGRKLWPFRNGWFRVAELQASGESLTLQIAGSRASGVS